MATQTGESQSAAAENVIDPDRVKKAEEIYNTGNMPEAAQHALAILADDPQHSAALNIAALSHLRQGDTNKAIEFLSTGCQHHPNSAPLHANLGRIYLQNKKNLEAAQYLVRAVINDPGNSNYKSLFATAVQFSYRNTFTPEFKQATQICLEDNAVSYQFLMTTWLSLLKLDPSYEVFWTLMHCPDYETFRDSIQIEDLKPCLDDTFLQIGIWRLSVSFWPLEHILTLIRRYILDNKLYEDQGFLPFLSSLSLHCFFNEYVFLIDDAEMALIADLYNEISTQDNIAIEMSGAVAMLGCYQSLSSFPNTGAIAKSAASSSIDLFQALIRIAITEPLEEQKIKKTIPSLTPPEDETSKAVQQQYEENPYPRWANTNTFDLPESVQSLAEDKKILVAGCGTGQEAVIMARYFPRAKITAIDLSFSSIAYALRKCQEYKIDNINFMQADILDLDKLDEQFDLIVCSGVLHHMKDPVAGLQKLLERLKPGGSFKIAVYSTLARRNLKLCQDWIKDHNIPATPDGIRHFRKMITDLANDHPMKKVTASLDFYSLSECRDLVFHVQEHTFTLPELKTIFDDNGLQTTRFILTNAAVVQDLFKTMFPGDVDTDDLNIWHQFEQAHPNTFTSMYNILLCRKDEKNILDETWIEAAMEF